MQCPSCHVLSSALVIATSHHRPLSGEVVLSPLFTLSPCPPPPPAGGGHNVCMGSVLLSCPLLGLNTLSQSDLGRKGCIWSPFPGSISRFHLGKPGQEPQRSTAGSVTHSLVLSRISYTAQDYSPKEGASHNERGLSAIKIKSVLHRQAHRPISSQSPQIHVS